MAGLDVNNLIVGQPDLGAPFYRAGRILENQKDREQDEENKSDVRKQQMTKFLTDYLNPNDRLTGTVYDPYISHGFNDLLSKGISLAGTGADSNTIMTALMPGVQKLDAYSTNAKLINNQVNQDLGSLKNIKGYNPEKIKEYALKNAFFDSDGNLKDPSTVDPKKRYVGEVLNNPPLDITTGEGLDDFAKNADRKTTRDESFLYRDKLGHNYNHRLNVTANNWEVPEVDETGKQTMVPKYDVFTDNKNPVMHDFGDTKAPIRLLDNKVFDDLMKSVPSAYHRTVAEVAQHLGTTDKSVDLNDPRARMLARAIAYDELNSRRNWTIHSAQANQTSPQETRIYLTGSPYAASKGSAATDDINNVFSEITKKAIEGKGTSINNFSATAQAILTKYVKALPKGQDADLSKVTVRKNDDGGYDILDEDGEVIAPIDFKDINLPANKGVKGQQKVLQAAHNQPKPEDLRKKYNY